MAPKSILKKTAASLTPDGGLGTDAKPQYTDRHREIALYHANLIQQQKDGETKITAAVEELIEFPVKPHDAASPARSDANRFCDLIKSFTTKDYDDLLEERNLADKCGYTLCPNPVEERKPKGKYTLQFSGRSDVHAIPNASIRQWCSQSCARRAIYIKVQLGEVPYWERQGGFGGAIELLPEQQDDQLVQKMKDLNVAATEEDKLQHVIEELALERGEAVKTVKPQMVMTDHVVENASTKVLPLPPSQENDDEFSGIEGYKIGVNMKKLGESKDDDLL